MPKREVVDEVDEAEEAEHGSMPEEHGHGSAPEESGQGAPAVPREVGTAGKPPLPTEIRPDGSVAHFHPERAVLREIGS